MKIYNTLTRQKEDFKPREPGKVGMYVCGATVYNLIHVGNARPLCIFDTLRRYLTYKGINVNFVTNFTDVDDKIIKRANEEGCDSSTISERYISEYLKDAAGLNVLPPTSTPKVTENIDEIIDIVEALIEKGCAYHSNGDVYFRTSSFKDYGKLSSMSLEDLQAGARIEVSELKEDPMDFAVWKAAKEGEPYWDSPWGKGRPGWHIECSAMAKKYIGDTLDIHGGGRDIMFPHHENEIAQSESLTGKPLANYWMHNGTINVEGKKMGKSLNNFFLLRDAANKYGYETVRLFLLQSHYRSPINFSAELLEAAKTSLSRLHNAQDTLQRILENQPKGEASSEDKALIESFNRYKEQFMEAMEDDLNTADAVASVFELVRELNTAAVENSGQIEALRAGKELLESLCGGILGLLYTKDEESIPAEVAALVEERAQSRKAKDFQKADTLRNEIEKLGYTIEETRQGTRVFKG